MHKIFRKYSRYYDIYQRKHHKYEFRNPWFVWAEYDILTLEELQKLYKSITHPFYKGPYQRCINLPLILKDIIDHYGEDYKLGTLVGLNITNEDYYYIYERNGIHYYDTCVNNLE